MHANEYFLGAACRAFASDMDMYDSAHKVSKAAGKQEASLLMPRSCLP